MPCGPSSPRQEARSKLSVIGTQYFRYAFILATRGRTKSELFNRFIGKSWTFWIKSEEIHYILSARTKIKLVTMIAKVTISLIFVILKASYFGWDL